MSLSVSAAHYALKLCYRVSKGSLRGRLRKFLLESLQGEYRRVFLDSLPEPKYLCCVLFCMYCEGILQSMCARTELSGNYAQYGSLP